jgi:hypothetical protein
VGNVQTEVSAADHKPASVELFVHILFDLLCDLLIVGAVIDCVADDVFGLKLCIRLQLRVEDFDSPFIRFLIHI